MSTEEILVRPIPKEMCSPPYGATFTVHDDHATVELPYVPDIIFVLPGETVKIALGYKDDGLKLVVTRERE